MSKTLLTILMLVKGLEICLSSGIYISNDKRNFTDAKRFCEERNQTLLVAPTYDEYCMFEKQFGDTIQTPLKFWIGIHKPAGDEEYKWVNDKQLNVYWQSMTHILKNRCVVASKDDALWQTAECSDPKAIVCVDYAISATSFTLHTQQLNYTGARDYCQGINQDLVMIKDKQQHSALKNFFSTEPDKDVWIGLRAFGLDGDDYWKFKWIDGEYLDIDDGITGTLGVENDYRCIIYTDDGKWEAKNCDESNYFICTGRFTITVRDEMTNYYDLVVNKKPYIDPLQTYTFNSKSKCATECSKSVNCYMYTYDGLNCELFKKSAIFITNDVPDRKLYLRRLSIY